MGRVLGLRVQMMEILVGGEEKKKVISAHLPIDRFVSDKLRRELGIEKGTSLSYYSYHHYLPVGRKCSIPFLVFLPWPTNRNLAPLTVLGR